MDVGASSQLTIDSISNIGPHYARTLREWRIRFEDKFQSVIEPALKEEYPEVMTGENGSYEIEVFKRKWICKWNTIRLCERSRTNLFSQIISTHRSLDESPAVGLTCLFSFVDSCYCEAGFALRSLGGSYTAVPTLWLWLNQSHLEQIISSRSLVTHPKTTVATCTSKFKVQYFAFFCSQTPNVRCSTIPPRIKPSRNVPTLSNLLFLLYLI